LPTNPPTGLPLASPKEFSSQLTPGGRSGRLLFQQEEPSAPGLVGLADDRDVNLRNCHVRVLGQQAEPGIHAGEPRTDRPIVVALTPEEEARLARLREVLPSQQAKLEQEAAIMDAAGAETPAVLPTVWKFRSGPNDEGESGHWFAEPPGAGRSEMRINQS
jgi:hypothetical protein